jgi:DNA repair protein RadC
LLSPSRQPRVCITGFVGNAGNRVRKEDATGLIAAHNHPSGAAEPSEADRLLTRDLLAASAPLGLRVLDHVIVAEEATYSFADSGLLDELVLEAGVR